jgi:hypothetical protein
MIEAQPTQQVQGVRKNFPKVKRHIPALIMDKNTPDDYIAEYPMKLSIWLYVKVSERTFKDGLKFCVLLND